MEKNKSRKGLQFWRGGLTRKVLSGKGLWGVGNEPVGTWERLRPVAVAAGTRGEGSRPSSLHSETGAPEGSKQRGDTTCLKLQSDEGTEATSEQQLGGQDRAEGG